MARIRQAVLAIAFFVCGSPALAQDGFVNVYEIPSNVSINVISNQLMHERLNKTIHHWDLYEAEQKAKKAAAAAPRAQVTGQGVSQLAAGLPKSEAAVGQAAYRQAFAYHEQVIRKFGLPSGDLGVGLASAVAGAWMAYNNKPFPDQYYVPLVEQMRQRAGGLQSLSAADRTVTYESLAVLGMLLASSQITWQRNPRAPGADALRAQMREQGGQTLTRMLETPPDRVGIGAAGVYPLR